jgi:hypothetical protein
MRDRELERRLRALRPREPDPHFAESLRARIRAEVLSAARPRPWWRNQELVLVNAALACCLVAMIWLPPERASPLARVVPVPEHRPPHRLVDPDLQDAYGPERMQLVLRMEGSPVTRASGQRTESTLHGAAPNPDFNEEETT